MSKLVDEDGFVYERGSDGQYRPKQGLFGPVRETAWWGQPNIEKDWAGNPEEERDQWGRPVQSTSGKRLYRSAGSENSSNAGGSSNDEGLGGLVVILLLIVLAIFVGAILVLGIPILITIWKKLPSSTGRKELGIFLAGVLALAGLAALSMLAWNSIAYGYSGWRSILYPVLALGCWGGVPRITIRKGWYKSLRSAADSLLAEYKRGVDMMLDEVGSFFEDFSE